MEPSSLAIRLRLLLLAAIASLFAGCVLPPGRIESTRPRHVVILPGILGLRFDAGQTSAFRAQVEREMPDVSAQVWDWTVLEHTVTFNPVCNLTDREKNQRRAARLAEEIIAWRRQHPDEALYLLGLSGGGGIALFTCELLPPDVSLEAVVLVSAAVSPQYDLTEALRRTRRGIYNYYSCNDRKILLKATTTHGTMDRTFGPSAGYAGFETRHARLFQLPWNPRMRPLGNSGSHSAGLRRRFAREFLLPLFAGDEAKIPADWRAG